MNLSPARRIVRAVFGALTIYVALTAAFVLGEILTHPPGALGLATPVIAVDDTSDQPLTLPVPHGHLRGQICSVFGDRVAGAVVALDDQTTTTDAHGRFSLDHIPAGIHRISISAADYEPLQRSIQIGEGDNDILLKYDTGLWPERFAADFHVFYPVHDGSNKLYGVLALANPADVPVQIQSLVIEAPDGRVQVNFLPDAAAFERFVSENAPARLLATPALAVEIPGRTVVAVDVPPLTTTGPAPEGTTFDRAFQLLIRYQMGGAGGDSPLEQLVRTAPAVYEPDWNPHQN